MVNRLSDLENEFTVTGGRVGEGNGNPLQCSCLESPRDGRAWWAAVYRVGVAQSQTRLKRLGSSRGKAGEGGRRESGMGMHTLQYLGWITTQGLLQSAGSAAQYYLITQLGKKFEKE